MELKDQGQFKVSLGFTLSNILLFYVGKNVRIFPTKNKCICNIYVLNLSETLSNDVINFEQLAPDFDQNLCVCVQTAKTGGTAQTCRPTPVLAGPQD